MEHECHGSGLGGFVWIMWWIEDEKDPSGLRGDGLKMDCLVRISGSTSCLPFLSLSQLPSSLLVCLFSFISLSGTTDMSKTYQSGCVRSEFRKAELTSLGDGSASPV